MCNSRTIISAPESRLCYVIVIFNAYKHSETRDIPGILQPTWAIKDDSDSNSLTECFKLWCTLLISRDIISHHKLENHQHSQLHLSKMFHDLSPTPNVL